MPKIKLSVIKNEFDAQIAKSHNLIVNVRLLNLPKSQLEDIVELAFLRTYLAWENFLEESFIRYMMGGKSGRFSPGCYVKPKNLAHALDMIKQNQVYVDWTSSDKVITRAESFFKNGAPYKSTLQNISRELIDTRIIRNRVAHRSKDVKVKFDDLIRRTLGHGVRRMSPGKFLLTKKDQTGLNYFGYYLETLRGASEYITP